jgi:hypothetical protein
VTPAKGTAHFRQVKEAESALAGVVGVMEAHEVSSSSNTLDANAKKRFKTYSATIV